jgi:ubiquinone/menaquinone biosynthesis C-methylase UbiE
MNERTFHGGADTLRDNARVELMEIEKVIAHSIENLSIKTVLDVGTGTGLFTEAFINTGLKAAGIDINEDMLAEARKLVPNGDFRIGRMEEIPFKDKSFDLVFLGHVLHEADDLDAAVAESARVAGKRIVILEWPYINEEKGPPLAHRLKSEEIIKAAKKAQIKKIENIQMKHMVLYRMDIL